MSAQSLPARWVDWAKAHGGVQRNIERVNEATGKAFHGGAAYLWRRGDLAPGAKVMRALAQDVAMEVATDFLVALGMPELEVRLTDEALAVLVEGFSVPDRQEQDSQCRAARRHKKPPPALGGPSRRGKAVGGREP